MKEDCQLSETLKKKSRKERREEKKGEEKRKGMKKVDWLGKKRELDDEAGESTRAR